MAIHTDDSNVLPLTSVLPSPKVKLYKAYLHTQDDPAVQELIIAASNLAEAKTKALGHVKKNNPHKGTRTHSQAVRVTRVLSVRNTGVDGCVAIHRIPLDVFASASKAAKA